MRHTLLKLSLLAAVISPLAARAAAMDEITVVDSGVTYNWFVAATPASGTFSPIINVNNVFGAIELPTVITTSNIGPQTLDDVYFGTTNFDSVSGMSSPGGIDDFTVNGGNGLFLSGGSLFTYTGTGTNVVPTFAVGTSGTLLDDTTDLTATYTISSYTAPAAAPEPSSLILLGTGALGIAGTMRRRLFA